MKSKLLILFFALLSSVSHLNSYSNEFKLAQFTPVHYDPSSLKIISHNYLNITTDLWPSVINLTRYAINLVHTSKYDKFIQQQRKELNRGYERRTCQDFQRLHNNPTGYSGYSQCSYVYSNHDILCEHKINPLFEEFGLYRFPEFQKALSQDSHFVCSILKIEQSLSERATQTLNPPGYYPGELEAIIHNLADQARNQRIIFQKDVEASERERRENEASIRQMEYNRLFKETQHKNKVISALNAPENDLRACLKKYSGDDSQSTIELARCQALENYLNGNDVWSQETYTLTVPAQSLLTENGYDHRLLNKLSGFQLQQKLHQEFITILSDTATLRNTRMPYGDDCKNISSTLTRFLTAGHCHNRCGYVKDAYSYADFCYSVLDMLKKAYEFECEIEYAIGRGFRQGSRNFKNKCTDPINTIRHSIDSIRVLGKMLLDFSDDIRNKAYYALKSKLVQTIQDGNDIALDQTTLFDVLSREVSNINYCADFSVKHTKIGMQIVWANLTRKNILDSIEYGTEIATEMALSHAALNAVGSLVGNGTKALEGMIDSGKGSMHYMDLHLSGATLEASIANEAVFARVQERALELAHAAGVTLNEAIDKASKIAPVIVGSGGKYEPLLIGPVEDLAKGYYPMADDIPEIHAIYHQTRKGFGADMKDKFIKIDLEHILDGKVTTRFKGSKEVKRLKGCHHDFMGYLEKTGKITLNDKIIGPHGTYTARVMGQKKVKSFFPQHWLRKEVIQNIFEAYDEFITSGNCGILEDDGKWRIAGISKIGLKIEMYITTNGTICTAYPV